MSQFTLVTRSSLVAILLTLSALAAAGDADPAPPKDDAKKQPHLKSWSRQIPNARERFVVLSAFSDQAVLDKETGLVWERSVSTEPRTWIEAMGDCYAKQVGGRFGWRLPAIEELATLLDPTQTSPPFLPSEHPFRNVLADESQEFWSSTGLYGRPPNAFTMNPATRLDLAIGVDIKQFRAGLAWCVRGGHGPTPDTPFEAAHLE